MADYSTMETLTRVAFWIAAFVASLFFGFFAVTIFEVPLPKVKPLWAWKLHQFWLNFTGSFVGWVALWFLGRKVIACLVPSCSVEPNAWDVAAFFLAFVGVTGFLPLTIVGLITGLKELLVKLAGWVKP
jgi:hypothetical protein